MPILNLENDRWFVKQVKLGKLVVTKSGKVFNTKTKKFIGALGSGQYPKISMADENKKIRHMQIHRLVWLVFKGKIKQGFQVNHKDGVKTNPKLSNLEVVLPSRNATHAIEIGLSTVLLAEEKANACLTNKQVPFIRRKFIEGYAPKYIAKRLKVGYHVILSVLKGKTYKSAIKDNKQDKIDFLLNESMRRRR